MKFLIPTLIMSAMLSACGGGTSIGNTPPVEPVIAAAAKAEFIALANTASCAQTRNRLFLIDGKQMFWDRVGTCADASYSQTLYGATPQSILCSSSDSIAGPRTTCTDEKYRAMFVQINQNLDKPDLGLGSAHQVTQLDIVPSAAKSLPFVSLAYETYFGTPPSNLVIRDEATWNRFLDDSKINSMLRLNYPSSEVEDLTLKIDFSKKMVIAVFFAKRNTCDRTEIVRLTASNQKIVAEYIETEVVAPPLCDLIAPGTRTPMNLVVVDRSELAVQFVNINAARVGYSEFLSHSFLQIDFQIQLTNNEQRIIKDNASFDKTFVKGFGNSGSPQAPDFSKRMLIVISPQTGGCGGTGVNTWSSNGKLSVALKQSIYKSGLPIVCTAGFSGARVIELDRSDLPIEFIEIPNWY
jgi:hypothetical protein